MSVDLGDSEIIIVSSEGNSSRQRFTIAHELGHLLMGHGLSACSKSDILGKANSPQEREAHMFSSRLLMPSTLFRKDIQTVRPRFHEISELAGVYSVSVTAAAIRYLEETRDACALIGFNGGLEDAWWQKSDSLDWYVNVPPHGESLIEDWVQRRADVDHWTPPAESWLADFDWSGDWRIREEVFQVWDDQWLVLLSEIPDPDDDPDRIERLIDSELDERRSRFSRY